MFSNRIARFSSPDFHGSAAFAQLAVAIAPTAQTFGGGGSQTMVVLPSVTLASWQEQVYRLAYQKALADTAPPRHFARFFSVWN